MKIGEIIHESEITMDGTAMDYKTVIETVADCVYLVDKGREANSNWYSTEVVTFEIDQIDELIALLQKAKEQASD